MALYGAETWKIRAADQKYLESFEMWCWRRIEKISWTDHVRNEEVLLRVNEQRNILHEIRKRKANWIGHILRRNCLLKQVIEGKIKGEMEVARRRGRRRKKLLDDLKDRRGYSHLKEEALDRTMWRHRFGRGFGPVVRQNTEWRSISWIERIGVYDISEARPLWVLICSPICGSYSWRAIMAWVLIWQGQEISAFFKASRPISGPTHLINGCSGLSPRRSSGLGVELITHFHVVSRVETGWRCTAASTCVCIACTGTALPLQR